MGEGPRAVSRLGAKRLEGAQGMEVIDDEVVILPYRITSNSLNIVFTFIHRRDIYTGMYYYSKLPS